MRTRTPKAKIIQKRDLGKLIIHWFEIHGRSFPWRDEVTPYRVAVAEALLQKTAAGNALPVFSEFIAKYPTVESLAAADSEEVVLTLRRLGLPRRARLLQELARNITTRFLGQFPNDEKMLRTLPGVGPYGAAAIACLAFGHRAVMIDINVMRIFERVARIKATPRSGPSKPLKDFILELAPHGDESRFNLALVDLGALVCRPRNPHCADCPVSSVCDYFGRSRTSTGVKPMENNAQ
jgi:A/G-specific adenine glycosylase